MEDSGMKLLECDVINLRKGLNMWRNLKGLEKSMHDIKKRNASYAFKTQV
jgi:hypothetical protein